MRFQNLLFVCALAEIGESAFADNDVASISFTVGTVTGVGLITLHPQQSVTAEPDSIPPTSTFSSESVPSATQTLSDATFTSDLLDSSNVPLRSDMTQGTPMFEATALPKNQTLVTRTVLVKSTEVVTALQAPAWYKQYTNNTLGITYG